MPISAVEDFFAEADEETNSGLEDPVNDFFAESNPEIVPLEIPTDSEEP